MTPPEGRDREAADWGYLQGRIESVSDSVDRIQTNVAKAIEDLRTDLGTESAGEKAVDRKLETALLHALMHQTEAAGSNGSNPSGLFSRLDSASRAALIGTVGVIFAAFVAAGGDIARDLFGPSPSPGTQSNVGTGSYTGFGLNRNYYDNPYVNPYTGEQYYVDNLPGPASLPDCVTEIQRVIDLVKQNPQQTFNFDGPLEANCRLNEVVEQQKAIESGTSSGSSETPSSGPTTTVPGR